MAAISLHVDVETHNTASKGGSHIPADAHEALDVTLSNEYISITSPSETEILDFQGRRRFTLDNSAKVYVEFSLYDAVGFRVMELQNREMLNGVLAAASVSPASFATVDDEQALSVLSRTPAKIDETVDREDRVFSSGGRQLIRWSKTGVQVSSSDIERFAKFLRYREGGHPYILSTLATGNSIPSRSVYTDTEAWGTRIISISTAAVHQVEATPYDLRGYSRRSNGSSPDGIDELLDKAANLTPEAVEAARARNREDVAQAFHDGRLVDALLATSEGGLMGGQLDRFSPEQLARFRGEPAVGELISALGVHSKEGAPGAAKAFLDLREKAPRKAYVLKIFEANNRLMMNDAPSAIRLFREALESNIAIAGVYKDLGDLLFTRYDTPRAWRCWDVGRLIGPQFSNFNSVNQFEKRLASDHPEYF
jgi:hypothetical protein